ncbi:hypothetical protein VP01_1936g1 [Puccinia sorghi]|uniref:Uncharacterized protein n=1 Tax=Puccinia sorghi TaxID=27349 RepID=A0A0L6VCE5_9BASI|nr:hypothetical protein VP01_1936g1 [Puccinia sorghi]
MCCKSSGYHPSNTRCMFCLEMIITHISYSHHFMTLIFFFYLMIALRIWIKSLLVSLYQFLNPKSIGSITPDNPNHGSLTKPTQLSQPIKTSWLSNKLKVQFMSVAGRSLKHSPTNTNTNTRAWKANQISSSSQFFCLEMIITHISYSHHFMTLIFFFYVRIALRICIKFLLVSYHQFLNPKSIGSITPENPNHGILTKPTQLSQPIKKFQPTKTFPINKTLVWVSHLAGQTNILSKPIISFSSSEDEPLLISLSPKPVFKSAKATVWCPATMNWGRIWLLDRLTALRKNGNTESQHVLHDQTYFSTLLFLKSLLFHHGQGLFLFFQRLNFRGYQLNIGPSSPKIRLNLCTPYKHHTTCISSVYDQVQRKHWHASTMETALNKFFILKDGLK